jgi:hypothetical protein
VPALEVFGCRQLPQDTPVLVGHAQAHVTLRIGAWTFHMSVNQDGRFPLAEALLPLPQRAVTACRLSPQDMAFLLRVLPRLPGQGDDTGAITLDLNGHLTVRARDGKERPLVEVALTRSRVTGPSVRLAICRAYLARAAALGFTEFRVARPDAPVVCRAEERLYAWMPLDAGAALPPAEDCVRLTPAGPAPAPNRQTRTGEQAP